MKTVDELIKAYERGIIPEALLFRNLLCWIPEKSIEEILNALNPKQKDTFRMTLVSVSRPGFVFLEGDSPPPETVKVIRDYIAKELSESSGNWK